MFDMKERRCSQCGSSVEWRVRRSGQEQPEESMGVERSLPPASTSADVSRRSSGAGDRAASSTGEVSVGVEPATDTPASYPRYTPEPVTCPICGVTWSGNQNGLRRHLNQTHKIVQVGWVNRNDDGNLNYFAWISSDERAKPGSGWRSAYAIGWNDE